MTDNERSGDDPTPPRRPAPWPHGQPATPDGPVLGRPADFEPTVKMTAIDIPPGPTSRGQRPAPDQDPAPAAAPTGRQAPPAPAQPQRADTRPPPPDQGTAWPHGPTQPAEQRQQQPQQRQQQQRQQAQSQQPATTSVGAPGRQPGPGPRPDPGPNPGPGPSSGAGPNAGPGSGPGPGQVAQARHQRSVDSGPSGYYQQTATGYDHSAVPWPKLLGVAGLIILIAGGVAFLVNFRSGGIGNDDRGGDPPIVNPSVNDMAQATVHILGLSADGQPLCSGSGTFVESSGMILTNAHVVTRDTVCDFTTLGIAVTTDSGRPPELLYEADVLVVDPEVDLAVIRVSRPMDPNGSVPGSFPSLVLGDSDQLMIGDNLRILGYPEIGGETITFTNGSVSGFTAQAGIGDRALIKTDATIAGGNSGGAAVNSTGQLIGIPTKARASESGPAVDCRPLADTNSDGAVDESDNCVPIGGFLNGIRPISLALPLIDQAQLATPQPIEREAAVKVDLSTVTVRNPRFSLGEIDNQPTGEILTAAAGIPELCLFVDWSGIPSGVEWDGLWYKDQKVIEDYSLAKQSWEFREVGSNFWMCAIDEQNGLGPGLYELGFFLNGDLVFAEGIVLTEAAADIITTTWENNTDVEVCGLAVNPQGSGPVGLDELPADVIIGPGESVDLELPVGQVVVEAYDCEGRAIADSAGTSIDINSESTYTITDPGG